ncbi:MAG: peptide deformylase [Leptospirales bacterium]
MGARPIKTIADSVMYKKSKPVTEFNQELRDLVRDMFDTMYEYRGVGLAAVQIGVLTRVLVIDLESMGFTKGVFINPEIVSASDKFQTGEEGCLSIPGVLALLKRPQWVTVKYYNVFGNEKEITGKDFMARALLHEMDHLDGKVFIDLLEPDIRSGIEMEIDTIKHGEILKNGKIPAYRK